MITPGAFAEFLFVLCGPGVAVAVAVAPEVAVALGLALEVAVAVAVEEDIGPRATPISRTLWLFAPLVPSPVTSIFAAEAPSVSGLN